LKLLATEGHVKLRGNRSSVVITLIRTEINELSEVVSCIERPATERATSRMDTRDIRKPRDPQKVMERHHEAGHLRDYFEVNEQVHLFILESVRDGDHKATHETLTARIERTRFLPPASRSRWDESVDEHRQIVRAFERRIGAEAGRLVRRHVKRTGEAVKKAINGARAETAAAERWQKFATG
jgi:DNA-binding GntR family transcriptional regulator